MPVAINSPARNFFLLGSSGGDVVTNFFRTLDLSSGNEDVYVAEAIKYSSADQKFITAGTAENNNTNVGWFEKRDDAGTADWNVKISATESGVDTTLRAMELDVNGNLIVGGLTGNVPWIAKYSNGGVIDWQSSTYSGDVEYTGVTSDSNGQYYACGTSTSGQAFVEKFDSSGNPGWGKSAFMLGRDVILNKIAANSRGEVIAAGYLIDLNSTNGYIVKIDTNTGEVLWDRTLEGGAQDTAVYCNDVFIDANDQIYIVGLYDDGSGGRGFIVKYSPEGNIIWQRQTPETYPGEIVYYAVKSDSETEQTIVFGEYGDPGSNDRGGILSKYSKDGTLVWRRTIFSSWNNSDTFSNVCLDSDSSFYYLLYNDEEINSSFGYPVGYTYGKVSSSGNGLGSFVYQDGIGEEMYYDVLNLQDEIGLLSDGSVRNDISDFITYPFNANKLLFDDLATQVTNKRRQMDSADSFEYSGSPAIRPADFQELNLLGDVYSGSGNWLDQSGKGNDGVVNGATYNAAGYWEFDGVNDYIEIPHNTLLDFGEITVEWWMKSPFDTSYSILIDKRPHWSFWIDGNKDLDYYTTSPTNTAAAVSTIPTNEWFHSVATISGSTLTWYINATNQYTSTNSLGSPTTNPIRIGTVVGFPVFGKGTLGEVRIYPRALTAAQVFQNYNATKTKYTGEPADIAARISDSSIVYDGLILNYDFSNRYTVPRLNQIQP